ncbi:MAG: hypothetical protein R2828_35435 [Saprospiraceae bacterium]
MTTKVALKGDPITPRLDHYETKEKWNHEVALCAAGRSIAISTYFGEWDDDHPSGHVDIFQWNDKNWEQVGDSIKGENIGDHFGYRLAITADGKRVFISGSRENDKRGSVGVYELHNNHWICIYKFTGQSGERIGRDIAISEDGRRIAFGNYYNKVKVYEQKANDSKQWTQIGEITGDKNGDQFGSAVDLSADGNILVVGAKGKYGVKDEESPGKVQVFRYDDNKQWSPIGQNLRGRAAGEFFGSILTCSSNGQYIAAGTNSGNKEPGLSGTGEVRWFHLKDNNWEQIGGIIEGHHENVQYGLDLALSSDGKRLAVSSLGNGDIEPQVHIYDLNLTGKDYQPSFEITPPPDSDNHTFANHISFTADGRTIAVSDAAERKVYVYKLPQSVYVVNTIEDQAVYAIEGSGKYLDMYIKANGPQLSKQVHMATLPDPLTDKELEEFLFRAHKTQNSIKFESIKYPGYYLAKAKDRIDNRYPIFKLELLQPQNAEEQSRAAFLIQGGYNSQPNSFAFVQSAGNSFFMTNRGIDLQVMQTSQYFDNYPEKRDEVSFHLHKKE